MKRKLAQFISRNTEVKENPNKDDASGADGSSSGINNNNNTSGSYTAKDRMIFSCYTNGTIGVCSRCVQPKTQCNCMHCRRCGTFLLTFRNRHHCRICWKSVCKKCGAKERVNDFLTGKLSRTCLWCAAPENLFYCAGLTEEESLTEYLAEETQPAAFQWGLYALLSVADAPRRCINAACNSPISYDEVCRKCAVPTVSLALHHTRRVTASSAVEAAIVEDSDPLSSETEQQQQEQQEQQKQKESVSGLSVEMMDALYARFLPNHADAFAFDFAREDTFAVQKIILSRIAASLAAAAGGEGGEGKEDAGGSGGHPHRSLALCSAPDAKLLSVERVSPEFLVFAGPCRVRFIAFPPTATADAMSECLFSSLSQREVWQRAADGGDGDAGGYVVASSEEAAVRLGGSQRVGSFSSPRGQLDLVETPAMKDLLREIVSLCEDGCDVVLCGHATGGSTATLLTALLLLGHGSMVKDRLMCVTYGSPLVACRGLSELLDAEDHGGLFHHFVRGSDVVPRFAVAPLTVGGEDINRHYARDMVAWLVANSDAPPPAGSSSGTLPSDKKDTNKAAAALADIGEGPLQFQCVEGDHLGDCFAASREPFGNNDRHSLQHQQQQQRLLDEHTIGAFRQSPRHLDAFGCYHFLWCGSGEKHTLSEDPTRTLQLLADGRHGARVMLKDHLMASYVEGIEWYLHSLA